MINVSVMWRAAKAGTAQSPAARTAHARAKKTQASHCYGLFFFFSLADGMALTVTVLEAQ